MSADDQTVSVDSTQLRLTVASEQLRLASTMLSHLATLFDDQDDMLVPHVERLESRAGELMRTAGRLARDMGVAERWGLDILFEPPQAPALLRPSPSDESIDLEPIDLLEPISEAPPQTRRAAPTRPPWSPQLVVPTPPLASMTPATDESMY